MGEPLNRCVIVGAAPFEDSAYLRSYLREDDHIIAADGGQRLLEAMGKKPHFLVGDFDSSMRPIGEVSCKVLPTRKDDTDVLSAIRTALEEGYRDFLFLGCLGGRFDHTLANVFLLRFLQERGAKGLLVDERHEVMWLSKGIYTLPARNDCFFSLLPYGGNAVGVTVRGAEYLLENATLDTAFPLGVSNGFLGKSVQISVQDGFLLLILAKDA